MNTLIVVLVLVILGILVYKVWRPVIQPPKRDVKPNEANLYFFYTNWCGFSQKAMPEWTKLEEALKGESYFGKTHVNAIQVDCEAEASRCLLYEIDGYPTVLLETKAGLTTFTKRPTTASMLTFLRESLGQERKDL